MNTIRTVALCLLLLPSFHVQAQAIPAPAHPPNGATEQPTTLTLRWVPALLASSYDVQISVTSDFTNPVRNLSGITATSIEVRNLAYSTKYYWRVRGVVLLAPGLWSGTAHFTTQSPPLLPPDPPLLSSPADGASGLSSTVTFAWSAVPHADTYQLQVSTDRSFATVLIDRTQSATSVTIDGLPERTALYWRVRAANVSGPGNWSVVWGFTTRTMPPAPPILLEPANRSVNQPTKLRFSWTATSGTARYHIQISETGDLFSATLEDSTIQTTFLYATGLAYGTTYHWRVRAISNHAEPGAWSETWTFTTASVDTTKYYVLRKSIDFPYRVHLSDYSSTDYKILGLPGASEIPFPAILPGRAGETWQAYWDTGEDENYWVEYDGSSIFTFSLGKAFWILHRGPWDVDTLVLRPLSNGGGEVVIPLHRGWNLITSPWLSAVPWPTVQKLNSTNEPLYRYLNGRYGFSGFLEPFEGFYFFNANEAPHLVIPPEGSGTESRPSLVAAVPAESSWVINISVVSGGQTDDLLWFGYARDALAGKDRWDIRKPRPVSGFGTRFHRPEWDSTYSSFATDIRPLSESTVSWRFTLETEPGSHVEISFNGPGLALPGLSFILAARDGRPLTNIRQNPLFRFRPSEARTEFVIFGGLTDSMISQGSGATPSKFQLYSNFPNPFNPSTTIEFDIPRETQAEIAVYDLLGCRQRILFNGVITPGFHSTQWDGTNDQGEVLPSGTYFCRLQTADGLVSVIPMILVR